MKMADLGTLADNLNVKNSNFICGVVEGFYGRPWTTEQRKDLFQKMKKWGMDSYLYAPKDDYKHRVYWRELYTVEEAEHLTGLITAAQECGVNFYYALSPGLDITYSSTKEVSVLKRKLEQVYQFGCSAFALLFDDIESEMSEADKEVFQSFAHAQVSITNEVYQHLSQPKFLLCPTQYCAARAVPNVSNSEYLTTLGSKLAPDIDIMWTGPKVISRLLTVESIEEITEVLRRPPVIWDNIHANDYDQKRVFLGPYQGRSPDLIPKLRGVLTNPNCEYGCNFVAIHTLAQWSRCSVDGLRDLSLNDSVSADIKLEIESEDGGLSEDVPSSLPTNIYHPRRALRNAINEWLLEFQRHKQVYGPIQKPQPQVAVAIPIPVILPSINTCMSLTATTTSVTDAQPNNNNQLQALAEVCSVVSGADSLMQPTPAVTLTGPAVVMNSLAAENKVISEPMDCKTTPTSECLSSDTSCSSFPGDANNKMQMESPSPSSQTMIIDPPTNPPETNGTDASKKALEQELRYEDLALLCDLFYLPFEHGVQAIQLLQEFNWLKSNAHHVSSTSHCRKNAEKTPEAQEWFERAKKLNDFVEALNQLMDRLTACNNRELLYDLYPYVWDMRGVVSLLNSYVKWLAIGHFPQMITSFTLGNYTWFSKGWKESFMSGDQEPWVFRGGLTADLQRLVPVDAGSDLFIYKAPDVPINKTYTIRPYLFEDEQGVYGLCRRTCLDGNDGSEVFAQNCDLPGDRLVAGFLILSPELCFVVEDETGIVGYACAALNAKQFYTQLESSWLPVMCTKYPLSDSNSPAPNKHVEEMIKWFHSFKGEALPAAAHANHPSVMCCSLLSSISDQSVAKRLVICLLAALRANGSFGVCVPVDSKDRNLLDFYTKLGFLELSQGFSSQTIFLGRSF